jgi:spore photoproduct lyase
MDVAARAQKRNKFGGTKYVYTPEIMSTMKSFFYKEIAQRFSNAKVLYWT